MVDQTQAQKNQEAKRFKGRLSRNLMAVIIPLAIIPTIIMGAVAYQRTRTLLVDQISEQINDVLFQETQELNNWFIKKNTSFNKLGKNQEFLAAAQELTEPTNGTSNFETSHNTVLEKFRSVSPGISNGVFSQFILMDKSGTVKVATRDTWEGLDLSGEEYINKKVLGGEDSSFIVIDPTALFSPSTTSEGNLQINKNIIIMTSYQLFDNEENLLGYIVGISDSFSIQNTLETNTGYLPESKIFLVTEDGQFIGMTTLYGLKVIEPSESQYAKYQTGEDLDKTASAYITHDDSDVFGLYDYYAHLNAGILIETPQLKIYTQINTIGPFTIVLVLATTLSVAIVIFLGSRYFINPINKIAAATQNFSEGDWSSRAHVTRNDEIGLLAGTFDEMAEQLGEMYQSMEKQVEERTEQIITAAEVARLATSAPNLEELLTQAVDLIVERFDYYHASIFLLDDTNENAKLRAATGSAGRNLKTQGFTIPLDIDSIVGWVAKNNTPRIASDISRDSIHLRNELLPETKSEAGLPISIGGEVVGVLDIQSQETDTFQKETIEILATLANQLASAIQRFRLFEGTEIDLQQISVLYRASRRIAQSNSPEEIHQNISRAIQQTTYISAVYISRKESLQLVENPDQPMSYATRLPKTLNIPPSQAQTYLSTNNPIIIRDVYQPATPIHTELLAMPEQLECLSAAFLPIFKGDSLAGLIIIGSRDHGSINNTSIQPFSILVELVTTALEKVTSHHNAQQQLDNLNIINNFSSRISNETDLDKLYRIIHEEITTILGEVDFYIALYDSATDHIEIPYLYEGGKPIQLDPFPLGEGLTSIVVRTKQPLMLVENTEQRAKALGARIIGAPAKSWLGLPLIVGGEVVGVVSVQDLENEYRFSDEDLNLLTTLSSQIAGTIRSASLIEDTKRRAYQLHTSAEIARDTSATLDRDVLLKNAVTLVRDRFDFYHASVFLLDDSGEFAVVEESTGEAGRQMIMERHKLEVGSKSIIGHVTAIGEPLIVNDVTQDPTHKFNPLLPETRAEAGIPLTIGGKILGALDVQSTVPYSFSPDDIEVLQILADQLAVAVINSELFTETQEHLAQHRLIHHVTTVAASSTGIDDALSSAVQGLRVTLGDRVAILLLEPQKNVLNVQASSGYEDDIHGLQISVGDGITGWVAEKQEPLLVNDVGKDPRYIAGNDNVRSELAVPLIFRGNLLGVLNVESDELNAFDEHDQDILGTLAGSLSAIVVNVQLSERQQQLFEITNKIRRSVNMETILETTANELSKVLRIRRTRIQVGGDAVTQEAGELEGFDELAADNGQEGEL